MTIKKPETYSEACVSWELALDMYLAEADAAKRAALWLQLLEIERECFRLVKVPYGVRRPN